MSGIVRISASFVLIFLTGCATWHPLDPQAVMDPEGSRGATPDEALTVQETMRTVAVFLGSAPDVAPPPSLLLFDPQSAAGRRRLRLLGQTKAGASGLCSPDGLRVVVVADTATPYGLATLRHEAAHAALARVWNDPTASPPFWLNEGVAALFEAGLSAAGKPLLNPERQAMLGYLLKTRGRVNLRPVLTRQYPDIRDGMEYAKAWGVLWYLQECGAAGNTILRRARATPAFTRDELLALEQVVGWQLSCQVHP